MEGKISLTEEKSSLMGEKCSLMELKIFPCGGKNVSSWREKFPLTEGEIVSLRNGISFSSRDERIIFEFGTIS